MISYETLFFQALRIRRVEEKIAQLYPTDKIQSPIHLSIGQEHHIAALMSVLKKEDSIFSAYRCHAVYLAKGGDLKKMFAELYGKKEGVSGGKAGSMHLCAPEVGMFGSSAVVSAVIPHALGMAYAQKIKKNGLITVSVTGDGSTEEGVFHECLNFAALKQLPVLFLIENNGLAIHAKLQERQAYDLEKFTKAYGIDYFKADNGYSLSDVAAQSREITELVRNRPMPAVFEVMTHRSFEHVGIREDYDKGYRQQDEYLQWQKRDPLVLETERAQKFLIQIDAEISEAVEFAEKGSFPGKEALLEDVY
jgi:TPP-dependent pyruvate/acetoin dehydrogenase alpha subunit